MNIIEDAAARSHLAREVLLVRSSFFLWRLVINASIWMNRGQSIISVHSNDASIIMTVRAERSREVNVTAFFIGWNWFPPNLITDPVRNY
jgi:hypothetical protein